MSKENIKKAARWELCNPWAKWYEFNSTHPLISKRIKSICKYCSKFNQQEFINFDEQKPESYIDDFAIEVFIKFLPTATFLGLAIIFVLIVDNITNPNLFLGTALIIFSISSFIPYLRSHKNKDYKNLKIIDLLSEVKVSGITSVPCIINGEIIGKGNPSYLFSEDFIIKDDTGIMFVEYKQPLAIFNTLFALLKSKKYINKIVEIKGWYRRSPIPYIEIHTITMDGITKKCHTYTFNLITMGVLIIISLFLIITSIL